MDLTSLQDVALTVTAVCGAITALLAMNASFRAWVKARWANRRAARVERMLGELVQSGKEATGERTELKNTLGTLAKDFHLFRATVGAVIAADPETAMFDAAPDGTLTAASETLQQWTGCSPAQLQRWGWLACVATAEERLRVRNEIDAAVRDVVRARIRCPFRDADGEAFDVVMTWTPIPEGQAQCEKFVVVLQRQARA